MQPKLWRKLKECNPGTKTRHGKQTNTTYKVTKVNEQLGNCQIFDLWTTCMNLYLSTMRSCPCKNQASGFLDLNVRYGTLHLLVINCQIKLYWHNLNRFSFRIFTINRNRIDSGYIKYISEKKVHDISRRNFIILSDSSYIVDHSTKCNA